MSDKQNLKDDEIDLMQLFQYMKNGISSLINSIVILILQLLILLRSQLIKNFIILSISGIIGGGIGFTYYKVSKPYFITTTVVNSPYLKGYIFKNEIDKLTIYCKENDTMALSKSLNIPIKVVKSIKGIEVKSIIDNKYITANEDSLLSVSNVSGTNFLITISLFQEGSDIIKIQNGLDFLFENNRNLSEQYNITRKALIDEKNNLLKEIGKLDTLKNLINKQIGSPVDNNGNNLRISVKQDENLVNDPLKIYNQTLSLTKQIIEIDKKLSKDKKIFFLNEFSSFQKHGGLSFIKSTVYGAAGFISIVIIILLLLGLNKYLAEQEKKFSDAKS